MKAYVGRVKQLWLPTAWRLNANAASLSKLSSSNETKPDAQLSLAADKEARAKSDKTDSKTAKLCCTDGETSTPVTENLCAVFFSS